MHATDIIFNIIILLPFAAMVVDAAIRYIGVRRKKRRDAQNQRARQDAFRSMRERADGLSREDKRILVRFIG